MARLCFSSRRPHFIMLITYFALVLVYSVGAFVQYANRSEAETFEQLHMSEVPPQLVMTVECSVGWRATQTSSIALAWGWDATPQIVYIRCLIPVQ